MSPYVNVVSTTEDREAYTVISNDFSDIKVPIDINGYESKEELLTMIKDHIKNVNYFLKLMETEESIELEEFLSSIVGYFISDRLV